MKVKELIKALEAINSEYDVEIQIPSEGEGWASGPIDDVYEDLGGLKTCIIECDSY